jgi:hypothetical protein
MLYREMISVYCINTLCTNILKLETLKQMVHILTTAFQDVNKQLNVILFSCFYIGDWRHLHEQQINKSWKLSKSLRSVTHHTMKTYGGSRCTAPLIVYRSTRWSFIPPRKCRLVVPSGYEAGWAPETVWTQWRRDMPGIESRSFSCTICTLSLYWLCCQAVCFHYTVSAIRLFVVTILTLLSDSLLSLYWLC